MSDHPPITEHGQIGGVQRTLVGDYVWWASEMCVTKVRVEKRGDAQGIPAWALRQIADDMDRRAAGDQLTAPPEPSMAVRIEAMRLRVVEGLRHFPQTHDELWRTIGSPQDKDAYAFDIVLSAMQNRNDIRVTDVGGRKAYAAKGS